MMNFRFSIYDCRCCAVATRLWRVHAGGFAARRPRRLQIFLNRQLAI